MRVPFHRPSYGPAEEAAVQQAVRGGLLEGDGAYSADAVASLARHLGHDRILLTTSGTHGLELAFQCLDIGPGDEVVCPAYTFVTTANAVAQRGGTPVFCDIERSTLTMDPRDLARCLTERTRAVVPVHYGGVACDMERLNEALDGKSISIVEDAAQALGSRYRGQAAGTLGCLGVLSFHHTKNISCGEGGALIVNDKTLLSRATVVREKGTNRSVFLAGEIDSYTWIDGGSSYLLSDLLAALLSVQIERLGEIGAVRERIWQRYQSALLDQHESGRIVLGQVPDGSVSNYHTFWFLARNPADRTHLLDRLQSEGVDARSHFVPLHTTPFALSKWGPPRALPVTEDVCDSVIRLPLHAELTDSDVDLVTSATNKALKA